MIAFDKLEKLLSGPTAKLITQATSVIAVIVVVVLFLNRQREQAQEMKDMSSVFKDTVKTISDSYERNIDRLATHHENTLNAFLSNGDRK